MTPLIDFLQASGIFLAGLLVRLLFFLAVLAAVLAPILIVYAMVRGVLALRRRQQGMEDVEGLALATRRFFTKGHAWLKAGLGGGLTVGLDDLAQRLFPQMALVELPRRGTFLREGEPAVRLRSNGRDAFLPAPVSGRVVSVNGRLARKPGLLNASPYGAGWLFTVEPASTSFRDLPTGPGARDWFRGEEVRLRHVLEGELGFAAADGGELIEHPMNVLPEDRWGSVVTSFLGAVPAADFDYEQSVSG
jgi:glycine cleavage system H lipoate-binding protein